MSLVSLMEDQLVMKLDQKWSDASWGCSLDDSSACLSAAMWASRLVTSSVSLSDTLLAKWSGIS
jgi:hypothetical protein